MPDTFIQQKGKNSKNFHVRGNEFTGKVISAKAPKTVTILRELTVYVPKFERYKKVRSKIHAHNPEWINAKEDDIVRIGETRKISKTKSFVVTEIVGHARHIRKKDEMKEERKKKQIQEKEEAEIPNREEKETIDSKESSEESFEEAEEPFEEEEEMKETKEEEIEETKEEMKETEEENRLGEME